MARGMLAIQPPCMLEGGIKAEGPRVALLPVSSIPECSTQTLALTVPWPEGSHVVTLNRK